MKKRILIGVLGLLTAIPFWAQQPLTLDSCRQMALRNNKQLRMAEAKINAAHYNRKAAFTAYLPGIDVTGGYIYNSREISLLNDNLKNSLPQMGSALSQSLTEMAATNPALGQLLASLGNLDLATPLNNVGQKIVDEFRTDTRNMWAGAVTLTQPIYMGGKLRAYNKITRYAEELAKSQQLQILRDSQGGRYAPFITAEVNKAIGLKQQSTTSLQSLVRAVSGGGTANIFNQQNNQFNNTGESEPVLTRDIAMSMIQKELADKGGIKEIEYVENQYDFKELPVVVATKQEGNRGDKEGLTLKKAELDSVTGDYHGALKVFEEDHHQIRREIEEGIDYEEIDPELEDNH